MENFIINSILWTLALYGLFELVKQVINIITYTNLSADGIYLIIGVKNQEEKEIFKEMYENGDFRAEAEDSLSVRDALFRARGEKFTGEAYRYDFEDALEYELSEYIMQFSDLMGMVN